MSPKLIGMDEVDELTRNTEHRRELAQRELPAQQTDRPHLIIGEFRAAVLHPSVLNLKAGRVGVLQVAARRRPFEVSNHVIGLVPVKMVDLPAWLWHPEECRCDEAMDFCGDHVPAIAECADSVALTVASVSQAPTKRLNATTSDQPPNTTDVRYLEDALEAIYGPPFFHEVIIPESK